MRILRTRNLVIALIIVLAGIALAFNRDIVGYFNLRTIVSEQLDGRLIPHRVNRLERLSGILERGVRSLEVDLLFRAEGDHGYFEVGHDETDARGVRVDRFLEAASPHGLKKLWLDVKNISADNIEAVNRELERLDSLYQIKAIAIVESRTTDSGFAAIRDGGFHTSYYLPTQRILDLLSDRDEEGLKAEADRIRRQIEGQRVAAVSYSLSIYPFVKTYLEPVIDSAVQYHTWDSVDMRKWNAVGKLKDSDYYRDARVKSIIYGY